MVEILTLVLAPETVARCEIVDLCEVRKVLGFQLRLGDTELVW